MADAQKDLRAAWDEKTAALPPGLVESFLFHTEGDTWRIVSIWESKEALMALRASGEPPAALVMFERAGAKPMVSFWDVERNVRAGA